METMQQLIYDTFPLPATMWHESGKVVMCNDEMVKFLECETKQDCIENFFLFSPEVQSDGMMTSEKSKIILKQTVEEGYVKDKWTHIINDEIIEIDLVCFHIKYEGESYISAYSIDLRDKKLRERAEEESRAKTKFLARMSHEIRTPMNAILGITEMQLQRDNLSVETEDAFSRIHSSSNLLLSIINDILDLSKVEAGKMEIVNAIYSTASMIVDTVQLNLMHVGSKSIEFKLDVDKNIPASCVGDENRIKQILNNILSNAFKYTDEGSVELGVTHEDIDKNNKMLIFRIKDTGQGMSGEQLGSLFEIEFTRFNLQSNRVIEGTGLGMNIAFHLATMMGGIIEADSKEGEGTTFIVRIPQGASGNASLGKEVVENLQNIESAQRALKRISRLATVHMPYGKVLVVDDVESNLFVAKGLLMPYKLVVETVDSGRAAVHKIRNGNVYDIIFMDHMMPGIDGIEATRRIREHGYTHPIVALTANTVSGQSELFMDNGFDGFISKPIDVNKLNTYLLRLIRDKQPPEVLAAAARDQETEQKSMPPEQTHSSPDTVSVRLQESFVRDAKRSSEAIMSTISRSFDVAAFKIYIIHTHAMKSALYNIGETNLSSIASSLEQAGREGDTATINAFTGGFLKRLEDVIKTTSEALNNRSKSSVSMPIAVNPPTDDDETDQANEHTIFVVDDSDTNLILAEEALDDYNVFTILSAKKMFDMLKKVKPDLILLDIQMPEMDGFEAMEILKAEYNTIPVVFLTATITPDITARAKKLGVAAVYPKPFKGADLQTKVEEWIKKPGSKPTVLIIDDTPMVISALSRMLLPLYSVKAAKDGREGLDLVDNHQIDLILLDINMPEFTGFDVLAKLKESEKTSGIPVIFITGSEEAADEAKGFSLGAVDFIIKPFVEEKVLHRVELHIHGGKS